MIDLMDAQLRAIRHGRYNIHDLLTIQAPDYAPKYDNPSTIECAKEGDKITYAEWEGDTNYILISDELLHCLGVGRELGTHFKIGPYELELTDIYDQLRRATVAIRLDE